MTWEINNVETYIKSKNYAKLLIGIMNMRLDEEFKKSPERYFLFIQSTVKEIYDTIIEINKWNKSNLEETLL